MEYNYPKFTKEMKKTHTILIPNMAILQFRILKAALEKEGYKGFIDGPTRKILERCERQWRNHRIENATSIYIEVNKPAGIRRV